MNDSTWRALYPHIAKYLPGSENVPPMPPMSLASEDIFRRVVHDDQLSSDDKIKFLKLIVPPPDKHKD